MFCFEQCACYGVTFEFDFSWFYKERIVIPKFQKNKNKKKTKQKNKKKELPNK